MEKDRRKHERFLESLKDLSRDLFLVYQEFREQRNALASARSPRGYAEIAEYINDDSRELMLGLVKLMCPLPTQIWKHISELFLATANGLNTKSQRLKEIKRGLKARARTLRQYVKECQEIDFAVI